MHFLSNNFYVGFGNPVLAANVVHKNPEYKLSLEHILNVLTFGPSNNNEALSKRFDLKGFNTLMDHFSKEDRKDEYTGSFYHSYYITAVPNIFDRMFGRILETFQYTASAYVKRSSAAAIIFM